MNVRRYGFFALTTSLTMDICFSISKISWRARPYRYAATSAARYPSTLPNSRFRIRYTFPFITFVTFTLSCPLLPI